MGRLRRNGTKRVGFEQVPAIVIYDDDLSGDEMSALWYKPGYLKAETEREIHFYRRSWTSPIVSSTYCWRGLEHRLKSNDAKLKRWFTFISSFLAFQKDLKELDHADTSKLLMVYATKHSQEDRKKAQLVGASDEAEAYKVYNEDVKDGHSRSPPFKRLHLKKEKKTKQAECRLARSA